MGAKKVSNRYDVSIEDVIEARKIYHREKKKIKKAIRDVKVKLGLKSK